MGKLSKLYSQVVQPEEAFEIQNAQDRDILYMQGTIPALSGGTDVIINVSQVGHFFCEFITGTFETIDLVAAVITDTGVNHLFGQLRDGTRPLFSDRIPFDLFLTPGRRKSNLTVAPALDPVGNTLFYPMPLQHIFAVNANITMNVASTSNTPVTFEIAFHGKRIFSGAAAQECRAKARG
ncbi:MAG: hypothetical protein PHE88_12370 [Elusimicrobia bacterium]|nr:hypothetical protein [Elusimicrobiota bacterium]